MISYCINENFCLARNQQCLGRLDQSANLCDTKFRLSIWWKPSVFLIYFPEQTSRGRLRGLTVSPLPRWQYSPGGEWQNLHTTSEEIPLGSWNWGHSNFWLESSGNFGHEWSGCRPDGILSWPDILGLKRTGIPEIMRKNYKHNDTQISSSSNEPIPQDWLKLISFF